MNNPLIEKRANQVSGMLLPAFMALILTLDLVPVSQNDSEVEDLLERATEKVADREEIAAMHLYHQVLNIDNQNYDALWNLSLLNSKEGYRRESENERIEYYDIAKELAEDCLEYHPEEAGCHYVYAVSVGRISESSGPRTRVRASREIKDHIDKALDIDPEHKGAWHLLGVWHSSAANLSGSERFAANLLFGGVPGGASNQEAEAALQRAIELDPDNILFRLDLARFYRDVDLHEEAVDVLREILQMDIKDKDDPANLEAAREMLERLQ